MSENIFCLIGVFTTNSSIANTVTVKPRCLIFSTASGSHPTLPANAMKTPLGHNVQLAMRKMRLKDLSEMVGLNPTTVSLLKTGKYRSIPFITPENICRALDCQPGDILQ